MESPDKLMFYKTHPKTCRPDDFWGQVMRTVNGVPVGEEQIEMIVNTVKDALQLVESDILLDLCCGNGALTDRLFKSCSGGLGVDFSEALIEIANQYFHLPPQRMYKLNDVEEFVSTTTDTERYTRCVCYGSFMFLPEQKARQVLQQVYSRFQNIDRFYIGNLPDRSKAGIFLKDKNLPSVIYDDPASPIGIWRTESEFADLARECGWRAQFSHMPEKFYAAAYRYDVLLFRKAS